MGAIVFETPFSVEYKCCCMEGRVFRSSSSDCVLPGIKNVH